MSESRHCFSLAQFENATIYPGDAAQKFLGFHFSIQALKLLDFFVFTFKVVLLRCVELGIAKALSEVARSCLDWSAEFLSDRTNSHRFLGINSVNDTTSMAGRGYLTDVSAQQILHLENPDIVSVCKEVGSEEHCLQLSRIHSCLVGGLRDPRQRTSCRCQLSIFVQRVTA